MSYSILQDNQRKRLHYSPGMLLCFAMFCFWQMGLIYFMGPSLTVNGRTPLPISMDNITVLIAAAYVLSIAVMAVIPRTVTWLCRLSAIAALVCAVGLFFPFSDNTLRVLIYTQVFCCCFLIGFETFIIVNFFSEESAVCHLTAVYGIVLAAIAVVQNDFLPLNFPVFRIVTVLAIIFLLLFYFRLPTEKDAFPYYVKKTDTLTPPKKLMIGTFIFFFIGSLMAVSGPSVVGEVPHGVFVTYTVDAIISLLIYFLYKKFRLHPLRITSVCIGLGSVGFLLMFVTSYMPILTYVACGLIGIGMIPCQMIPLYCLLLMKSYPSRFFAPLTIGLALAAVLVQSSMVEWFRDTPTMLYLTYAVIMVILTILFLQIEPYFVYKQHRDSSEKQRNLSNDISPQTADAVSSLTESEPHEDSVLSTLSKRETEVVDLITDGYSNAEIAKTLYISVHTVNDYTKKIYRKFNVHSRLELAARVTAMRHGEHHTDEE